MSGGGGGIAATSYVGQLRALAWLSAARLVRAPSHTRRAEAARRWARQSLFLAVSSGLAIILLMVALDATEIGWMPPRGTAWLWPLRVLTDFGKSAYMLWLIAAILLVTALLLPRAHGMAR